MKTFNSYLAVLLPLLCFGRRRGPEHGYAAV